MAVGFMKVSEHTMKSSFLSAAVQRCGCAAMAPSTMFVLLKYPMCIW